MRKISKGRPPLPGVTTQTPAGGKIRKGTTPGGRPYIASVSPKGSKSVTVGGFSKTRFRGGTVEKVNKAGKTVVKGPVTPKIPKM